MSSSRVSGSGRGQSPYSGCVRMAEMSVSPGRTVSSHPGQSWITCSPGLDTVDPRLWEQCRDRSQTGHSSHLSASLEHPYSTWTFDKLEPVFSLGEAEVNSFMTALSLHTVDGTFFLNYAYFFMASYNTSYLGLRPVPSK